MTEGFLCGCSLKIAYPKPTENDKKKRSACGRNPSRLCHFSGISNVCRLSKATWAIDRPIQPAWIIYAHRGVNKGCRIIVSSHPGQHITYTLTPETIPRRNQHSATCILRCFISQTNQTRNIRVLVVSRGFSGDMHAISARRHHRAAFVSPSLRLRSCACFERQKCCIPRV
jgi:hypothetical protein